MGREVGGGFRIGNTCTPVAQIHVDVWQNQYSIVKLKKKKNRGEPWSHFISNLGLIREKSQRYLCREGKRENNTSRKTRKYRHTLPCKQTRKLSTHKGKQS